MKMNIKDRIASLLKSLNQGLYEKEQAMGLALLSAIAGESIFLLGAPGVAKSLIARRLKYAFKDGKSFEYLMNRFSTPDEIFGPVSISGLKADRYERKTEHYLPWATVVFLDEIWKAGPSIQNALLTVLNERVYRNGAQEVKVNMKALISASNELPAQGEGLEALWDRFLVRLVVEGIQDKGQFNEMITVTGDPYQDTLGEDQKISDEDYKEWNKAIDEINVPENVLQVIQIVRAAFQAHNDKQEYEEDEIYISDRRWRKIVRLLRTSAFLNGRNDVDLMDCFLIGHCVWNDQDQVEVVNRYLKAAIEKNGYKLKVNLGDLKNKVAAFNDEILRDTRNEKQIRVEDPQLLYNKYYQIDGMQSYSLISKSDFEMLSSDPKRISLHQNSTEEWNRQHSYQHRNLTKSSKPNHLNCDGKTYKLEVTTHTEQTITTYRPNDRLKKAWDDQVLEFLVITDHLKFQIQEYRTKDLAHLRSNVFVHATLAKHVETNITDTLTAIEKIEVEIKRIQHHYETVKDETKTTKK